LGSIRQFIQKDEALPNSKDKKGDDVDPEVWRAKYSGMDASALKRLKELVDENRRQKQLFADLSLDHRILKDIVEKNYKTRRAPKIGWVCRYRASNQRTPGV
jgi:putative transposase